MEFCPYGDLGDYLLAAPKQSLQGTDVRRIIQQLVTGIRLLHESGFAHRDLKPAVSLYMHEQVARRLQRSRISSSANVLPKTVFGTSKYLTSGYRKGS